MESLVTLPPELRAALDRELGRNEQLAWVGQPQTARVAVPAAFVGTIGLLVLGVGSYIALTVVRPLAAIPDAGMGWFFPVFIATTLLGGLAVIGVPLYLVRKLQRTVYAITNERALILEVKSAYSNVQSFTSAGLGNVSRKVRRNGSGDLVFAKELRRDSEGHSYYAPVGFLYLPDVQQAEQHLIALLQKA